MPDSSEAALISQELEQAAIRLLASREHSKEELRRKLSSRVGATDELEQVLDALETRGYQSDERFVEQYIGYRKRKGFGPLRIRKELLERGVDTTLIDHWLDELADEWSSLLEETASRKFGSEAPADFKARAKRARFLEYRGFSTESIRQSLWRET